MKHTRMWYILRVNKILAEIKGTPKDEGERFLLLKKKAQKYLKLAKQFDGIQETGGNHDTEAA